MGGPYWFVSRTLTCWRLAELQTPIVAVGSADPAGSFPVLVSSVMGTWMAIEWTLNPLVPSTPVVEGGVGMSWSLANGLSVPRSKIEPRST